MACPNKNDKNWKVLSKALGDLGAYAVFAENGTLPDVVNHPNYTSSVGKVPQTDLVKSVLGVIQQETNEVDLGFAHKQKTDAANRNFHLIENKRMRISKLNTEITKAKNKKQIGQAELLTQQRDALEDEIGELESSDKIEMTLEKGYQDIGMIRRTLEKGMHISDSELDMLYKTASLWAKSPTLFIGAEEKAMLGVQLEKMHDIAGQASDLLEEVNMLMRDNLERYIKASYGSGNMNELQEMVEDISWHKGQILDVSRIADDHIAYLFMSVKKANTKARSKAEATIDKLEALSKPLKKRPGGMKAVYDLLAQKYSNGKNTGSLVTAIKAEYQEEKFKRRQQYLKFKGKDEAQFIRAKAEYISWVKDNEITMDPRKILAGDQQHIDELKSIMGNEEYERRKELLEGKLKYFDDMKVAMKDYFDSVSDSQDDADLALKNWEMRESPYLWAEYLENPKDAKFKGYRPQGYKNTYAVPRDPSAYDDNFKTIQGDSEMKAYYDFVMDTMKDLQRLLPDNARQELRSNSIPFVEKSLAKKYDEGGFHEAGRSIFGTFIKSVRTKEKAQTYYGYQDPVTGDDEMNLRAPSIEDKTKVNEVLRLKKIEYKQKTGTEPGLEETNQLYKEARIEVAESKSMDLNQVMAAFALETQSYYHRAEIEDQVKLLKRTINQKLEVEKANGEDMNLRSGQGKKYKSTSESFKYAKAATGSFIDTVFYGKGNTDEGVTKKTIYTPDEKKEMAKLDKMLENPDLDKSGRQFLEKKKAALGGKVSKSRIGDKVLQWVQMKGMGYNFIAGITNLAFGHVSNFTHAAGAEDFNMTEYMKGWSIALNTIGGKKTKQGKKVIALMKKFDVLKESAEYTDGFTKAMKDWGPYMVNRRTEIMNQSPVMIAMMMNMGIWEDFDEDGNYTGKGTYGDVDGNDYHRFKNKLDQVMKSLHGNYDPDATVAGKEKWIGRALLQFRGWMGESFANRFEDEKYDRQLGRLRKGRYQSYELKHLAIFPALKDFHSAFTGKMENEVDAANMRKNAVELSILLGVVAMMALLSGGDDEDEKKAAWRNFLINELLRVKTDIAFYVSPMSFEALTKQSVPAMSIVSDTWDVLHASWKFFNGDDIIKSGPYAEDSRLARETLQWFPFLNQVPRWKSTTSQIFDK